MAVWSMTAAYGLSSGNVMGKLVTPTTSSAPGVWNLQEQQLARNASIWPGMITPAVATGGTITTISGYKVHTFTSSGTFTVTGAGSVQYLVIAGGGGGGYCGGGGIADDGLPAYVVTAAGGSGIVIIRYAN